MAEYLWDPSDHESHDEPLHPGLSRHLTREAFERGDLTFSYWQENFYQ